MTNQLTIHQAHQLLKSKQLSSVELTKSSLERIHQLEPKVHALVTVTDELALKQARKADELIASGNTNPLTGIPMVMGDNQGRPHIGSLYQVMRRAPRRSVKHRLRLSPSKWNVYRAWLASPDSGVR